jgi:hypothetical protein
MQTSAKAKKQRTRTFVSASIIYKDLTRKVLIIFSANAFISILMTYVVGISLSSTLIRK